MRSPHEPFIGVWELDPDTLDYQHGRPGRRALYTIESLPEGLRFVLDADDADGKRMHHVYGGNLDGDDIPIPGTPLTLALGKPDEYTIESTLKEDGRVLDRWTRVVQEDGDTMLITQHGFCPDGKPFRNNGIYRRVRQAQGTRTQLPSPIE
jgi:hypothetical protein